MPPVSAPDDDQDAGVAGATGRGAREAYWKQTAGEVRQRMDRLHRSVLDKDVLRRSLPLRARTLASRSGTPDARERERRLRELSLAYADAVDDKASFAECARRIAVDGLAWWVPLMRPDDPVQVERAIQHQDFPYRVIAQTRDLAIGGAMIDIGANVGRMCIPRVILGDVTAAYCAEPDPLNFACLTRNLRDNGLRGLVLPDRLAVGGRTETVRFRRSKTAGGHKVVYAKRASDSETIDVPMITFDDWVARLCLDLDSVTFVKVDAQGSEVGVLQGAAGVLARRHIAWQIEVDPHQLQLGGTGAAELIGLVQRHFTHFIDLNRHATGVRVRPVAQLPEAIGYIDVSKAARTDILACTLADRVGA